jgi:hypothetical protein
LSSFNFSLNQSREYTILLHLNTFGCQPFLMSPELFI